MAIDRRIFLLGGTAALSAAIPPTPVAAGNDLTRLAFVGVASTSEDVHFAAPLTAKGTIGRRVPLPGRGHDVAFAPSTGTCVAFARRPGTFAVAFNIRRLKEYLTFQAPPGRHFFGHGIFSPDGRTLYATENDYEAGVGVIGVYDATRRFRRIGEFASFGVGPHDLGFLADGTTLVVANGGYREHPRIGGGRRVLNADRFETTLAYIDARHGSLHELHDLSTDPPVSFRHLAIAHDDTVFVGGQAVAPGADAAVFLSHRRGAAPRHRVFDADVQRALAGYVSSMAISVDGQCLAATSSRGGVVIVLGVDDTRSVRVVRMADVSGIAGRGGDVFLASNGYGALQSIGAVTGAHPLSAHQEVRWDNHLRAVSKTTGRAGF